MTTLAPAPRFSDAINWLNCAPQRLEALRGRVVVLGFWHAGSAASLNLLDDLAVLQQRHSDGLVAVAIHTPKFDAEEDGEAAIRIAAQAGAKVAVANDPGFVTWQHYGIRAWPSVAVIDTEGNLTDIFAGDRLREPLEARVAQLLDQAAEHGRRAYLPPPSLARPQLFPMLGYPAGILATSQHLYIADTGRHRILECNLEGRVLREFGSGTPGWVDGSSGIAGFRFPRGLCLVKDTLYVADGGNHAVRRIRLTSGDVDTLLGNGTARQPEAVDNATRTRTTLHSPFGVAASVEKLYVAMTGEHQIWELDLVRHGWKLLAGSGRAGMVDGAGKAASFAEPVGLALVQSTLYLADSANSALRSVHVGTGQVQTLVGQGPFEFGYRDGPRETAQLQYPLGLAHHSGQPVLWVADTCNNQIRQLRLGGGELGTLNITGATLVRPSALAATPEALWVANTGAHEILKIATDTGAAQRLSLSE